MRKNYVLEARKHTEESQAAALADRERQVPGRWWESAEAQAGSAPLQAQQWVEPAPSDNDLEKD